MALSYKIHHQDFRVYALVGDGESEEGQIWEAAMAAAHYKLDKCCDAVSKTVYREPDIGVVPNEISVMERIHIVI